jgi:hypothetical protein
MTWTRKSPFTSNADPVEHMVELLSNERANVGTPFNADEKQVLRRKASNVEPVPEELRRKSKAVIEQLLKRKQTAETNNDPKSFNNSLEWAGESDYPNIVALTEAVVMSGTGILRLHGRGWVKDKIQVIGCALIIVLFMLLLVVGFSLILRRK